MDCQEHAKYLLIFKSEGSLKDEIIRKSIKTKLNLILYS